MNCASETNDRLKRPLSVKPFAHEKRRQLRLAFLRSVVTLPPLAAIFFSLRRVLRLGLRIADSFGQHLAQLGLRLWSLARERFLPLGHVFYVGMPEGN
jgi:hypothetical protein